MPRTHTLVSSQTIDTYRESCTYSLRTYPHATRAASSFQAENQSRRATPRMPAQRRRPWSHTDSEARLAGLRLHDHKIPRISPVRSPTDLACRTDEGRSVIIRNSGYAHWCLQHTTVYLVGRSRRTAMQDHWHSPYCFLWTWMLASWNLG